MRIVLNFVRQANLAGPQTNRCSGATWVIDSATYPVTGANPGVVALPNGSILMTVSGPAGGG